MQTVSLYPRLRPFARFGAVAMIALALTTTACESSPSIDDAIFTINNDGFVSSPSRHMLAGPVRVDLLNTSDTYQRLHIVQLNEGKTADDLMAHLLDHAELPAWAKLFGGPNVVAPDTVGNAIVNLESGNYYEVSLVPDAVDSLQVAPSVMGPLIVIASQWMAEEPAADAVIYVRDDRIELPGQITVGRRVIRVNNEGAGRHGVLLVKLKPGIRAAQFLDALGGATLDDLALGRLPGEFGGGLTDIEPDTHGYFTHDFTPDAYALFSFADEGLAMIHEFTVKW